MIVRRMTSKKFKILILRHRLELLFLDNICYPPYGCFSKQPPFDDSFTLLPEDPTSLRTSFHLYTRGNKFPEAIYPLQGYVPSTLKINTTTVILAHGYTGTSTFLLFFLLLLHVQHLTNKNRAHHCITGM